MYGVKTLPFGVVDQYDLFSDEGLEAVEHLATFGGRGGPHGLFRLADQFDELVEHRAEMRFDFFVSAHRWCTRR